MRGMVDLNKSGSTVTLAALSTGNTGGGTGKTKYFEKYLDMGSPFDAQTEDEQEEDVLETSVSFTFTFQSFTGKLLYYISYFPKIFFKRTASQAERLIWSL